MTRKVGFVDDQAAQAPSNDGWEGILMEGEDILWQGQPAPGLTFSKKSPAEILMGLFFMGFSIFWMNTALAAGGFFWMFGLIFFVIGFYNAIGCHFWESFQLSNTFYSLSNKRGFVATTSPFRGRSLKSYSIEAGGELELLGSNPATVNFARVERRGSKGRVYHESIGFRRIEDAPKVFDLIQRIQRGSV